MKLFLPDANVLIYALHKNSAHHRSCRKWLETAAANNDAIGLCELVEVALLRIPTLPKLDLLPMRTVLGFWREDLLTYSQAKRLTPLKKHADILSRFISDLRLGGNDINDAWLAALAIEHRATLVSADEGFSRFSGLDWLNPLGKS